MNYNSVIDRRVSLDMFQINGGGQSVSDQLIDIVGTMFVIVSVSWSVVVVRSDCVKKSGL